MGVVTCVTAASFSGVIWITAITLVMEIICTNALHDSSPDGSADPRCERVGQLLEDSTSACHYLVCQHGSTIFKEIHGDHSYFTSRMPCAPGTHVLPDFTDTGYSDQESPCVGTGNNCAEKSNYPNMRYPSNKVNHGYAAPRQVARPTGKKGASAGSGDKRRLRQLVGLLQNIVYDVTVIFSSLPKEGQHATQVQAVGHQWAQVNRQVDGMLAALSPGTEPDSGRAAVSLRTDPRTLHKFSHKMLAVILRVMRLNDKTDQLMRRLNVHGLPTEEVLHVPRGVGGSSKSSARPRKVGGMHHSTDVFMMRSMMDRLRQDGGGTGKYPKYHPQLHAGYTDHTDSGYGDYEEARSRSGQTSSRETSSREANEVQLPVLHNQGRHESYIKETPGPPPGAKLNKLPTRRHFRSYLRSQMRKSLRLARRAHGMSPSEPRPPGTRSARPQHSYKQPRPQQAPPPGPGSQGQEHTAPTWLELGDFGPPGYGEDSREQHNVPGSASSERRAGYPEGRAPQRPTAKHHGHSLPSLVFSKPDSYQHGKQPLRTSRSKLILYDDAADD